MFENVENKATRGTIAKIILTALADGDKYGYEICKEIERLSNGDIVLKQPSLYSSLRRMEESGFISSYWQDSDIGGKRHYYSLTEKGREAMHGTIDEEKMEDLMQNLPLNDIDGSISTKNDNNDDKHISVVSQENLFNLAPKTDIKYIDETQNSSDNNSFVQYDLFNQNIKFVKDSSKNNDKVEVYKNKYEDMDNHGQDIEPIKNQISLEEDSKSKNDTTQNDILTETSFKNIQKEPITRESVYGASASQLDEISQENLDKKENYDNIENNDDFELSFSFDDKDNKTKKDPSSLHEDSKQGLQNEATDIVPLSRENETQDVEKNGQINKNETTSLSSENEEKDMPPNDLLSTEEKYENATKTSKESNSIVWDNLNDSKEEIDKSKSNDYKMIIGQLYSSSKLADPYEENKFYTFKEIFPTAKIEEKKEKVKGKSEYDELVSNNTNSTKQQNIKIMQEQFSLQGLRLKMHDSSQNKNKKNTYVDVNRLSMNTAWIVSFIMLLEVIFCYIFLKKSNNIVGGQSIVYFLAGSLAISVCIIISLENLFDRFKLIEVKPNFKQNITKMLIIFLFLCIIIFATCLICGMESLLQKSFISYWLVPILMSSNLVVYTIVYHLLYKTGKYNN